MLLTYLQIMFAILLSKSYFSEKSPEYILLSYCYFFITLRCFSLYWYCYKMKQLFCGFRIMVSSVATISKREIYSYRRIVKKRTLSACLFRAIMPIIKPYQRAGSTQYIIFFAARGINHGMFCFSYGIGQYPGTAGRQQNI